MNPIKKDVTIGDCRLILGDCLEVMPLLGKVDCIVTDPPYGTTNCKWDSIIPLDPMWKLLRKCTKPTAVIAMTSSQPFTSKLVSSNYKMFRYSLVWDKIKGTGFLNAKKMPLRNHEDIVIFYEKLPTYNPQRTQGHSRKVSFRAKHLQTDVYGEMKNDYKYDSTERGPRSIIAISTDTQNSSLHPTQKPVALMENLVNTYTDEGNSVLDFAMGSGTTLVACAKLGRKGIGIELDPGYFEIACKRVQAAYDQPDLFVEQPTAPTPTQEELEL